MAIAAPDIPRETPPAEAPLSDWTAGNLSRFYRREFGDSPLLVVTHREPVVCLEGGGVSLPPGGVSQTIHQLLSRVGGRWIALRDSEGPDALQIPGDRPRDPGYRLERLSVAREIRDGHYAGFSNGVLWPYFHDQSGRVGDWDGCFAAYAQVNLRFAGEIVRSLLERPAGAIWIHDYQLALVAREVRRMVGEPVPPLSFFWHIPWTEVADLAAVPWMREIVDGLLFHDQVGFQTRLYRDRFLATVRTLYGSAAFWDGTTLSVATGSGLRAVRLGVFPISIDPARFEALSSDPDGILRAREFLSARGLGPDLPGGRYLISVDRMDYSKGFLERLEILDAFYARNPGQVGALALLQIAPPTRQGLEEYRDYADQVRARVRALNDRWGRGTWRPVRMVEESLDQSLLAPLYRLSEGALVTATRDGMNLVAKEYLASQGEGAGVLFLSRYTGAAQTMEGLSLIDPLDPAASAGILRRELAVSEGVRRARNRASLAELRRKNVFSWMADNLLSLRNPPLLAFR